MSGGSRLAELEDVLDALVAAEETPRTAALHRWVREYPQFELELVDFMASWSLMNSAASMTPDEQEVDEEAKADERLMLRGMSIAQNLLHEMSRRVDTSRRLDSILGAATAAGMNLRDLARAAHLGEAVVRKLDRRLIRFASIPKQVIHAVADAVRCQAQEVALYLQQPATFATRTHYRADRAPQLAEPEEFIVAVEKDPTMTTEDRRRWQEAVDAEPS
jgi:hypothetical protein